MKKWISMILALVLLFGLVGCRQQESIHFYYPRTQIQYGVADGVIAAEPRELEGTNRSLEFILKLYLEGPVSQDLRSPFPKGTALANLKQEQDTIVVTLSPPFGLLEDLDYIIACACVASTCFALTEAESVTVATGQTQMTLTRDNLSLADQAASIPE